MEFPHPWIYGDDSESDFSGDEEDKHGVESSEEGSQIQDQSSSPRTTEIRSATQPGNAARTVHTHSNIGMADTTNAHADSDIYKESDDEIASLASENVADFWMCDSPVTDDADPRAYKLNTLGRVERKFGLHGECGLALAEHDKFTFDAPWGVDDMTPHEVREHFRKEMREMRDNTLQ